MFSALQFELRSGDIFVDVPIPVLDHEGGFRPDPGPAMLVDHDCQVCKRTLRKLTFAPLRPLLEHWPDRGLQGTIRSGDVRHLLALPAHAELDDEEFVVDLSEMFTLPRAIFDLVSRLQNDDPREHRWDILEENAYNERAISLSDGGRRALTQKLVDIFRLDELFRPATESDEGEAEPDDV